MASYKIERDLRPSGTHSHAPRRSWSSMSPWDVRDVRNQVPPDKEHSHCLVCTRVT